MYDTAKDPRLQRKKRRLNLHSCVVAVDRMQQVRGRGRSLDEENERLSKLPGEGGAYLHPTKGHRTISPLRMRAQRRLAERGVRL